MLYNLHILNWDKEDKNMWAYAIGKYTIISDISISSLTL